MTPVRRRVGAQARMELRLLVRNGENLLASFGIPAGLLGFFVAVDVLPTGAVPAVDFLLPGALVAAVMGSALVALAISTGYERSYLVLKRLGATPLRRRELVAAKLLAILGLQLLQVTLIVGVALALGWPREAAPTAGGVALAAGGLVLGTAAFGGLGLALAGSLRASATLALANTVFVLLLLGSGLLFPLAALPAAAAAVAALTPAAALADVLRAGLSGAWPTAPAGLTLCAWAAGAPLLAARVFRWW